MMTITVTDPNFISFEFEWKYFRYNGIWNVISYQTHDMYLSTLFDFVGVLESFSSSISCQLNMKEFLGNLSEPDYVPRINSA